MSNEEARDDMSHLHIPLAEETVEAHITERELGKVVIKKRVEVEPVTANIDLQRDDVTVDRVARDEVVTEAREPWYDGDTLVIPLYEEQLVTEIRLVLKEEVRVRTKPTHKRVSLKDEIRREVIDINTVKNDPASS
ncbi:MAG: YsnF/AvaK domain-containing protein [Thermomicrobiales bacterium]